MVIRMLAGRPCRFVSACFSVMATVSKEGYPLRKDGVEFEDVEVKRAAGGMPQNVAETMSAFANSRGGLIIRGLDERSGFVPSGVSNPVALRDELAGIARGKLTPPLAPSIEVVPFEGANLVLAEVEPLPPAQRPCYVTTRGLYNGAYVRVGAGISV